VIILISGILNLFEFCSLHCHALIGELKLASWRTLSQH
jgi:hypothetical protein